MTQEQIVSQSTSNNNIDYAESPTPPDYLTPLIQALLFIASVYLQKFVRKRSKLWGKQHKQLSRIIFVSALTLLLMAYNYSQKCQKFNISLTSCFYLHFSFTQCFKVIIANTILFAYHISQMTKQKAQQSLQDNTWRKLIFAPILQQLLFRAVFFRSGGGQVSIYYLSAIFSLSHLHRHIRKAISGKNRKIAPAIFQLAFTYIFSLYTYYFLVSYKSVIPCIILHMYCNFLGPPIIRGKKAIFYHFLCIFGFFLFLWYGV